MTDPIARVAIDNYASMARRLRAEADRMERRKQPLTARHLRRWAVIVDNAAAAEDANPPVVRLSVNDDGTVNE